SRQRALPPRLSKPGGRVHAGGPTVAPEPAQLGGPARYRPEERCAVARHAQFSLGAAQAPARAEGKGAAKQRQRRQQEEGRFPESTKACAINFRADDSRNRGWFR